MNTAIQQIRQRTFGSDILIPIRTTDPALARTIAWADAHPTVWRIVTGRRSKAFGLGSCEYIGWAQRSTKPEAVLERARHLMELLEKPGRWGACNSIFTWRARFTLEHFEDKGFTGGFFQQHDTRYPRSCLTLDYTPASINEVLDRFCAWMDRYHHTARVTLNGLTVRTFREEEG